MRFYLFTMVVIIPGLVSCDSKRQNLPGIAALGVNSMSVDIPGAKRLIVVWEVDGVRKEWLSEAITEKCLYLHVQIGLPDDKMRLALAGSGGSVCSPDAQDLFKQSPFSLIPIKNAHGPGEYTVMETRDSKLKIQNRIIVIAK